MNSGKFNPFNENRGQSLVIVLYHELKALASARLARLPAGQTLQATALVHEAYLRLQKDPDVAWNDRAHFFGSAARAIRDILVDAARRKQSDKRGGGWERKDALDDPADSIVANFDLSDVLTIHEALEELAIEHERKARIVDLRYFAGLTHEEIAAILQVSTRTIEADWRFARAWLFKKIGKAD